MNRIKEVSVGNRRLGYEDLESNMVNGYTNRQQDLKFLIAKILEVDPKELIKTDKPSK